MLHETLIHLREEHRRNAEHHKNILSEMISTRERNADIRRRIRDQLDQDTILSSENQVNRELG